MSKTTYSSKSRRILLIAYHFPPVGGSSGVQRTLKFASYLREYGWEPMVLTVTPHAYERVTNDQMSEIPEEMLVERAFALDSSRHLAIGGHYLGLLAIPDRWVSWWLAAVWRGMQMIRRYRPTLIMSTFPIPTAHLIGFTLQRLTGIPWVADFRDNMTDPEYPPGRLKWRLNRSLEAATVRHCCKAIFTTPGALEMYAQRYPDIPASRWAIIENGYDEENFLNAEKDFNLKPLGQPGQITLIHSGILYPQERDPEPFFAALRMLKKAGVINAKSLNIILRATASDNIYQPILDQYDISDIVHLAGPISYKAALQEMLCADGLLLFQAAMCNHQIPAKLYEYFRAGRPILALTDAGGDTANLLRSTGTGDIVNIADEQNIADGLRNFIERIRSKILVGTSKKLAINFSRRVRTQELAGLLDDITNLGESL